jgi:hypothetical protein
VTLKEPEKPLYGCVVCGGRDGCGICETCDEHCEVKAPGDVAAHLAAFDEVIARTPDAVVPAELVAARSAADQRRREREKSRS